MEIEGVMSLKAKELEIEDKKLRTKILCALIHSNCKEYNFYKFINIKRFGSKIYRGKTSIKDAIKEQVKMEKLLISLKQYNPVNKEKKT